MPTHIIDTPGFKLEAVNLIKDCANCCNRDGTINLAVFQPFCERLPNINCTKVEEYGPFFKIGDATLISGCGTSYMYMNYIQLSNQTLSSGSAKSTSNNYLILICAFLFLFIFNKVK